MVIDNLTMNKMLVSWGFHGENEAFDGVDPAERTGTSPYWPCKGGGW